MAAAWHRASQSFRRDEVVRRSSYYSTANSGELVEMGWNRAETGCWHFATVAGDAIWLFGKVSDWKNVESGPLFTPDNR